jgi:phenylacetate-coenzyme A ligase PaaK-like adenylate-forming protein
LKTSTPGECFWNEALETTPWAEVENWQARQISEMLGPLRKRSPFYARLHAQVSDALQISSLRDLSALPYTFKDQIRLAQEQASDLQPLGENQGVATEDLVQVVASSGTTGAPLYYGLTAQDLEMFTDVIANTWYTAGLRRGDVVAHLVGLPMVAGGLPYADGFRRIGATLCWLGGFPTDRILREMRRLRVTALLATTSFGLYLSDQWDAVGDEVGVPSKLSKAFFGGEPGLNQPAVRTRISAGLKTSHLRDGMGLGDVVSAMWSECDAECGMHFNAQKHVAIELIDPQTGAALPWEAGLSGEIVYTAFTREATPMIRYRSRDHALVMGAERCACGRTSPRITCIGRTDDMLIYKGMNVFPTAVRDLIVERFAGQLEPMIRIWKDRKDQVRFDEPLAVDVEAAGHVDLKLAHVLAGEIEQVVRTQLQIRVSVSVLAPGQLPRAVYKNAILAVRGAS